jgi:hypothetical protein
MALNLTVLELVLELQSLTNQTSQATELFLQSQKMGQMAEPLLVMAQADGEGKPDLWALTGRLEP